jgi:hypothetical protein
MVGESAPAVARGVLSVPEAVWLRWNGDVLEVGAAEPGANTLAVAAEHLTLVGSTFARLPHRAGDGRRLWLAARFPEGAVVRIERRGASTAVAASPRPRS